MRYLYTLILLAGFCTSVLASEWRGFLITKDDHELTGYFRVIRYTPYGNLIEFTNDFGDVYAIQPQLVKGFGFSIGQQNYRYISRFHEGQWFFLRLEQNGRALRLFSLPDGTDAWVDDRMLRLFAVPPPRYWFEFGKGKLLGIPRAGFKRTVREFMRSTAPGLAARIGKKGYRYRDLNEIVTAYNDLRSRKRRRL